MGTLSRQAKKHTDKVSYIAEDAHQFIKNYENYLFHQKSNLIRNFIEMKTG